MQECDSTGVRQHYVLERETKLGLGVSSPKLPGKPVSLTNQVK